MVSDGDHGNQALAVCLHANYGEITGSLVHDEKQAGVFAGSGSLEAESNIRMDDLCLYASRPLAFVYRYLRLRPLSHAVILAAVLGAVACSVGTQYGVKFLVDVLSNHDNAGVWTAFILLGALVAADNLLWRIASWIANSTFVGVTGDLRRDLFRER